MVANFLPIDLTYCTDEGIQRQLTNLYNHAQNGVSERKNRTLVESSCSMLKVAQLSNSFWAEALNTSCYLQNCSYTSTIDNVTPHELWIGLKSDLQHLRIFGCLAYAHLPHEKCHKLATKSGKCLFIGYGEPIGVKGY